jgi:anti-sigma B factor antagonist
MKVIQGDTLTLSDIADLDAEAAESLCREVHANLVQSRAIEIDLSQTQFLNSSGLGGLLSVHKLASAHNGGVPVRVINPTPSIQQLLELTRLHRLVEIVNR